MIRGKTGRLALVLVGSLILVSDLHAGDIYVCTFDKNGWKSNDWIFARRPDLRQDLDEGWIQGKNYIENNNPTHTSMVYGKKLKADLTVSSTMSFGDEMAPSIVLAVHLDRNEKDQLEYQEHFEIVLYNNGVNVWLHRNKNGKSHWTKTAFWKFRLEKDTKYVMTVTIKEKELTFSVGDRKFGYAEGNLPDEFYVGITGQEGINRFYNFRVHE